LESFLRLFLRNFSNQLKKSAAAQYLELKDGRLFDQVVASEGRIIDVRGYKEIPFVPDDVALVNSFCLRSA